MLDRFRSPCPCCGKGDIGDEVKEALVALEMHLGRYPSRHFVHVDCRKGAQSRWTL